ncbi:YegP family protein [Nonomuraea sp. NPDC049309]|uniref:YegP family protein n=1 Tax=Nonomuraea sp. NPDC049309 TaxID=3364350 RepID=UPI003715B0DE
MTGKFVISGDEQGGYRFALVAGNGQTLAVGEGFPTKVACVNGIETVRRTAPGAVIEDHSTPAPVVVQTEPAAQS